MERSVESRVLEAIVNACSKSPDFIEVDQLVAHTGADRESVQRALRVLSVDGDLFFRSVSDPNTGKVVYVNHVTPYARQVLASDRRSTSADQLKQERPLPRKRLLSGGAKAAGALVVAVAAKLIAQLIARDVDQR
jgi:hypothetical protein